MIDERKVARICKQIEALAEIDPIEWGEQISKRVAAERANSAEIANVLVQLKPATPHLPGALKTWRELLVPLLQAQIGLDQSEALRRVSRSSNWLAFAALIFTIVQAFPLLRSFSCWIVEHL